MRKIKLIILFIIIILIINISNNAYAQNYGCEIVLRCTGNNKLIKGETREIDIVISNIKTPEGIVLYNGLIEYDEEKLVIEIKGSENWELYYQTGNVITLSRKDLENSNKSEVIGKLIVTAKTDVEINNSVKLTKGEVTDGKEVFNAKEYVLQEDDLEIKINKESGYEIKQDGEKLYLENIKLGETIETMLGNIETNGEVKIYKGTTEITDKNTKVATGMTIKITLNSKGKEYIIVVIGDLNGDGQMNDIDLLMLARYKAKLYEELKGEYLRASDIVKNGEYAEDMDLLKMARILVGLDSI